ncbi:glycosyltransferase family 4 protein [Campylobacter curvus]|uniref:glycosyltransferase family 4 protein n=1 Tax=Campylobacter curvus TaxID=200 RepID=UPI0014704F13|nr:glycosyltransferase family 4 protein [Campylobacter curvus]
MNKKYVLWFMPNLISTDLTKNYSILQDYLCEKLGYSPIILTNNIADKFKTYKNIERISFIKTRKGYFYDFFKILKYISHNNIFLVYDNSYWMLLFLVFAKKVLYRKIKCIVKLDSSLEHRNLNKIKYFLFKFMDLIICESMNQKIKLEQNNLYNIQLLYNSLLEKDIIVLEKNTTKEDIILYAGRITSIKHPKELLEAFVLLKSRYKLIFCGPLQETGKLVLTKYQIDFLELVEKNKNIEYLGNLDGNNFLEIFKRSKIFILPSMGEGLPNVLAYAMFSRNLILSTNVGSIGEYLNENNSIIMNNVSVDGIKKYLEYAITNIDTDVFKNKVDNAYSFAKKNLNYNIYFERILERL